MEKYVVCECTRLEDNLFFCFPVRLPKAEVEGIYIGPTGAYVIACEATETEPSSIRTFLRSFLGTAKVELYLRGKGRYIADSDEVGDFLSEEELQEAIRKYTQQGVLPVWNDEALEKTAEKIRFEDARNRGVYRDKDGNWFVALNGNFQPLSDKDPNKILRLTLFGGILGAHRFALGKWFTGILYLLTGGLIGLGWFMDLIQLAFGTLKDKEKRLLAKPEQLPFPWYLAGFAASFVLFCVYGLATGVLSGAIEQVTYRTVQSVDPAQANAFMSFLQGISGK